MIYQQYRRKLSGRPYGLKWLRVMLSSNRVIYVNRARDIEEGRLRLAAIGFVGEDFDYYVRTCASSCCKVIATYDSDFSHAGSVLWKHFGIKVKGAADARVFAEQGTCARCDSCQSSPPVGFGGLPP